jgi:hypothetical protein
MCKPILANYWNPECDEATARQIMIECFKILFYRHCRTTDKYFLNNIVEYKLV